MLLRQTKADTPWRRQDSCILTTYLTLDSIVKHYFHTLVIYCSHSAIQFSARIEHQITEAYRALIGCHLKISSLIGSRQLRTHHFGTHPSDAANFANVARHIKVHFLSFKICSFLHITATFNQNYHSVTFARATLAHCMLPFSTCPVLNCHFGRILETLYQPTFIQNYHIFHLCKVHLGTTACKPIFSTRPVPNSRFGCHLNLPFSFYATNTFGKKLCLVYSFTIS